MYFLASQPGQLMRGPAIYQAFVRTWESTGVTISFHDLRHTGESLAAAAGASRW